MASLTLGTGPTGGLCGIYVDDGKSRICIDEVDTHAPAEGEIEVTVTLRAEGYKSLYLKSVESRKSRRTVGSVVRFKQMTSFTFADVMATVYSYDALGRLRYDVQGWISQTQDPQEYPSQTDIYTRDLVGNVTDRWVTGDVQQETTFAYDAANRLTAVNSQPVSYDDNGNMLSDGQQRTFTWDKANRLIQVQQGGNTYQHAYNGLGQRIRLTQNGVETRFLYDGQSKWVIGAESESQSARFLLGPMGLLAQQTSGSPLLSPLLDRQGSVRAAVREDQQAEIRCYSPHGSLVLHKGDPQTAYGFGGGYEDPSGLNYLFTSFYHPGIGQGVQQLGPAQQFWSNYSILANYAGDPNNPLGWRVGISLLAGVYGGIALIPAAVAIAMNPELAVGTGLIAAGVSGVNYELERQGYGGPVLQQQAQNSSQLQAMIEGGYFGAISGPVFGALGAINPMLPGATGMTLSGLSMANTAIYANTHGGWTPYDRFNFGLAAFGFGLSAFSLGSAVLQQNYELYYRSLANLTNRFSTGRTVQGNRFLAYEDPSSGWRISVGFKGIRPIVNPGYVIEGSAESVIYGSAPAIRGFLPPGTIASFGNVVSSADLSGVVASSLNAIQVTAYAGLPPSVFAFDTVMPDVYSGSGRRISQYYNVPANIKSIIYYLDAYWRGRIPDDEERKGATIGLGWALTRPDVGISVGYGGEAMLGYRPTKIVDDILDPRLRTLIQERRRMNAILYENRVPGKVVNSAWKRDPTRCAEIPAANPLLWPLLGTGVDPADIYIYAWGLASREQGVNPWIACQNCTYWITRLGILPGHVFGGLYVQR